MWFTTGGPDFDGTQQAGGHGVRYDTLLRILRKLQIGTFSSLAEALAELFD